MTVSPVAHARRWLSTREWLTGQAEPAYLSLEDIGRVGQPGDDSLARANGDGSRPPHQATVEDVEDSDKPYYHDLAPDESEEGFHANYQAYVEDVEGEGNAEYREPGDPEPHEAPAPAPASAEEASPEEAVEGGGEAVAEPAAAEPAAIAPAVVEAVGRGRGKSASLRKCREIGISARTVPRNESCHAGIAGLG